MGQCYITRRGAKTGGSTEQLGIYPVGSDGRPTGDVVVPDVVTSLSNTVFKENKNISSVVLGNNVLEIETECFRECTNLQRVKMSDNIATIPNSCFESCTSLTEINIPKSCTKISDRGLRNTKIAFTEIPEGIITLGSAAFFACNNIIDMHIPKSITTIGASCFAECVNLQNVTVAEKTSYVLQDQAFRNCQKLSNISVHNIMEHYSTVYNRIFEACDGLTNVEVSHFWNQMFYNCKNLIKAKSLRGANTGNEVFYGCSKLQEVYIADGTETIGIKVFSYCTSLKIIYLPSSITTATSNSLTSTSSSYYAFYNCTALEDVQLGQDWNMNLRLDVSNKLTVDSMIAMFNSLKDLTGDTAKTLTLGSTNLEKLTDEQKAIATNKNWTLA